MSREPMSLLVFCVCTLLAVGSNALVNVSPTKYNLTLLLDTDKDIFSGSLVIDANVLVPGASNFALHNNGLNITTVSVVQKGGANAFRSMSTNPASQLTLVSLNEGLTTDLSIKITIAYEGNVSTDQTGLFSFQDNGKKIYMTNLYPIYARKLFPCFDEPGAAAAIALTLILTNDNGNVIGSTPIVSQSVVGNYKAYQLNTTIPIAPYSFFFTVGDWSTASYGLPKTNSKLLLPPSLNSQTTMNTIGPGLLTALSSANISMLLNFVHHLNIFVSPVLNSESYTGLNTVVLREDMVFSNLGEVTSEMEKNHLVRIGYAIMRLFFGTAVRPANWGNNWLTTSLPLYFAYNIFNEPQVATNYGNAAENLVSGLYETVFAKSDSDSSAVVYTYVSPTAPKEILDFVQSSGVEKGVYCLTTMETVTNPANMKSAMMSFLFERNNSYVTTEEMLNYVDEIVHAEIAGSNLTEMMMRMLSQTGYPLVRLARHDQTLELYRTAFVKVGTDLPGASQISQLNGPSSWLLPVTVTTSQNPNPKNATTLFFHADTDNPIDITGRFPMNEWALLNLDGKGIMRVSYDYNSSSLFGDYANSTFSPATRAKLIADAFATAESTSTTQQPWEGTLKLLTALNSETQLAPWKVAVNGFRRMWSWIWFTGSSGNTNSTGQINLVEPFTSFVRAKLTNIYNKLGPIGRNDDPSDPVRREVVAAMCEYGDPNCLKNLTAQFNSFLNKQSTPSNEMLSVVMCYGLQNADENTWSNVFNNYVFSGKKFPQIITNSHYSFLACPTSNVGNSAPINKFLSIVLLNATSVPFPRDQIVPAISEILNKPQHVDQVLSFFVQNQPSFNFSTGIQADIIIEIGKRLTSPTQTAQLKTFSSSHNLTAELSQAVNKSISLGEAKARYIVSIQNDVKSALDGQTPAPPTAGPPPTQPTLPGPTSSDTSPTLPTPTPTPKAASTTTVSVVALLIAFAINLAAR